MIPQDKKDWIDKASYAQLLGHWRFAQIGDPYFVGELGDYYKEVMARKRKEIGSQGHVETSKALGW
jgi:hypothetical protein